ncbi:PREDICTED: protein argonaute-2-like, partial [Rhagoletis zephyria]|uniref:protein argonaute-2-like n=1 Tax=Rhagoletis zephyria TaxID=28612 RepID=UPI00081159D7
MAESVLHEQLVRQGLGSGSEGRPVELLSNFFKITTNGKVVYHYSIGLQKMAYRPEDPKSGDIKQYVLAPLQPGLEVFIRKCSAEILGAYFQQNAEVFGRTPFVHDGAQKLYSTRPLDLKDVPQVQTFTVGGREARFAVTISLVGEIDLRELDNYYAAGGKAKTLSPAIIPVYEQVFRFLIEQQFTAYQSSFYDPLQRERSKSSRAFEFVCGFSISVRMTEFGLALNIHSNRSSAMVSQHMTTVDRFVKTYLGLDRLDATLSEVQLKQASKLLRGLKVKTTHTGEEQFFIIDCLSSETPTTHTFKMPSDDDQSSGGGKSISVREHFQSRYNMTLLPNLNLVKTTAGKKGGDGGYKIHLPMEKCHFVEHQFINDLKLPTMLQTELIELSSSPPNIYFAQVAKFAELISQIDPPLLGHFGLQLTTLPAKVPARVLDLPPVLDNQGTFYRVAEPPEQWAVVCFDLSLTSHQLTGFIESMREVAKGRGMKLCKPFPITTVEIKDCYSIFNCFDNMRILTRVSFVVFILPSFCPEMPNGEVYKAVKYFSDTEVDFISQCVRAEKAKAPPKGYFENVLDKINAKIGGINTAVSEDYLKGLLLPFEVKETMLVGIDVNHPGQFDKIAASIAAAVGTSDSTMTAYSCSVRVQEKFHSEAVEHIGEM